MVQLNMGSSTDLDDFINYSIEKISNSHEIGTDTLKLMSNEFENLLKNKQNLSSEETQNKVKILMDSMNKIVDILTDILKEVEMYDHVSTLKNKK